MDDSERLQWLGDQLLWNGWQAWVVDGRFYLQAPPPGGRQFSASTLRDAIDAAARWADGP